MPEDIRDIDISIGAYGQDTSVTMDGVPIRAHRLIITCEVGKFTTIEVHCHKGQRDPYIIRGRMVAEEEAHA